MMHCSTSFPMLLCVVIGLFKTGFATKNKISNDSKNSVYNVPSFALSDLSTGRHLHDLARTLRTTGLIAVPLGSDFSHARESGLGGLCDCTSDNIKKELFLSVEGTDTAMLSDRVTTRTTFATATMGETPLGLPRHEMEEACGFDTTEAMDNLRDHVALVSRAFVSALDRMIIDDTQAESSIENDNVLLETMNGGMYSTVSSIVQASSNLEHFHVYSKSENHHNNENEDEDDVLGLHTDAGLFLSFVPGRQCEQKSYHENGADSDFYVSVNGELRKAVFPPGSVGLMLGAGAEHWLNIPAPVFLRATQHAVRMQSGDARSWYGMMHLVPQDAIVQYSPKRSFADMRKAMVLSYKNSRVFGDDSDADADTSIGCGSASQDDIISEGGASGNSMTRITRRRLQHVDDASVCNNSTNFYCWMGCMDIPQAQDAVGYINEGYSLYCVDPSILASTGNKVSQAIKPCNLNGVAGGNMNVACTGSWQPTAPGVLAQELSVDTGVSDYEEQFCYGGTSMYMDGFHWTDTTCVIYLFPNWVLSTYGHLAGACFGTLLFGMSLEGIIRGRRHVVQSLPAGWNRLGMSTFMYGLQLTMGYLLMLLVMTYSGPLFLCVILGLMGGHFVFNARDTMVLMQLKDTDLEESTRDTIQGSDSMCCVPEGSTPCCQNEL